MQNHFGDDNVNLSVCAPEAGMPRPEALRRASSLTVAPLFLSTRNHVNSEKKEALRNAHREGLCWEHEPKTCIFRRCVAVARPHGFFDVEMFHKTHFGVCHLPPLSLSAVLGNVALRGSGGGEGRGGQRSECW